MYMRHALSNLGSDQDLLKNKKWWEDCSIQRNISQEGREQAFKVGSAIRQLKLPIAEVKAAQFCRTRDTAYLLGLGPVEIEEGLNHIIGQRSGYDVNAARFQLLTTPPPKGQNIVMVSHTHGSPRPEERIMSGLAEAEIAIFRPDGKGGTSPVARIPLAEWDNLTKLSIGIPQ
jgi:phosphohistidine phosphatase SixA